MKKVAIIIALLMLASCTYTPVNQSTKMSKSAQEFSMSVKDTTDGLYLYKDLDDKRDYLFQKTGERVALIEKYRTNNEAVSITLFLFVVIILLTWFIGLITDAD